MKNSSYLSAYEDGTECSETSAYKIQTPENYPEESIQHSEQGESVKLRKLAKYLRWEPFNSELKLPTVLRIKANRRLAGLPASCWISITKNYDTRNYKYRIYQRQIGKSDLPI